VNATNLKRRRFQFSLRALLVFVTLCAVLCSWVTATMQRHNRQLDDYRLQRQALKLMYYCQNAELETDGFAPPSGFPQCLFGTHEYGVTSLRWQGPGLDNAALENLKRLTCLRRLQLCSHRINDAGLENLEGLKQLREVDILCPQVTDEGVNKLQQALPNCKIASNRSSVIDSTAGGYVGDYIREMKDLVAGRK
jgi:hypothetical protein